MIRETISETIVETASETIRALFFRRRGHGGACPTRIHQRFTLGEPASAYAGGSFPGMAFSPLAGDHPDPFDK